MLKSKCLQSRSSPSLTVTIKLKQVFHIKRVVSLQVATRSNPCTHHNHNALQLICPRRHLQLSGIDTRCRCVPGTKFPLRQRLWSLLRGPYLCQPNSRYWHRCTCKFRSETRANPNFTSSHRPVKAASEGAWRVTMVFMDPAALGFAASAPSQAPQPV
jgi:hypothetical protein